MQFRSFRDAALVAIAAIGTGCSDTNEPFSSTPTQSAPEARPLVRYSASSSTIATGSIYRGRLGGRVSVTFSDGLNVSSRVTEASDTTFVGKPVTMPASVFDTLFVFESAPPVGVAAFSDDFESGGYVTNHPGGHWLGQLDTLGNVRICRGGANGSAFALCLAHKGQPFGLMSSAEQRFTLTNGASEIWIEYDFYVPSNFYHRDNYKTLTDPITGAVTQKDMGDNNKFLSLWEENYDGKAADGTPTVQMTFEYRNNAASSGREPGSSYLYLHGTDYTGKTQGGIGNKWLDAWGPSTDGRWINMRVHIRLASTDGATDGAIEVFADRALVISKYGFPSQSMAGGHYIRKGYLTGWSNSGFSVDTEFKVDNFRVMNTDPRWK